MKNVKIACVQMQCVSDRKKNIAKAETAVRTAAKNGAKVVLLPELFERNYFCQERRYAYYDFAERTEDNLAVQRLQKLSAEFNIVLPVSFYEKDGNVFYNSVAVLDGGKLLGVYRKTHIPDDHYYQEKFYFTPGNTGFRVWDTKYARIGVGICWDQWFPETARCLALKGAELLFFPTAIGSEPVLDVDSAGHWQRCMQGHAAANLIPVLAANRYGAERVEPSPENGGQHSELTFYGSSFITDESGALLTSAGRDGEAILCAEFDMDTLQMKRLEWGLFRDRRPNCYTDIVS